MKRTLFLLLVLLGALGSGCLPIREVKYDTLSRPAKTELEIYREGKEPAKSVKEIASYVFDGIPGDEPKAENAFIKRAKLVGADGVVIRLPVRERQEIGVFGVSNKTIFKAVAFVYVD